MERPALLVLVRHGESDRNVAKKGNIYFADDESRRSVRGVADRKIPLTAEGIRQAEVTGQTLRAQFGAFHYAYHSGYRRTIETTDAILRAYPDDQRAAIEIRHNLFIRERDAGHAYDMTTVEAEAAFPWLRDYWQTAGSMFAHPPGGESLAQVCERVYLFLNMLFRDRGGQRILVVTHGGTLRAFRFLLERWTYEEADQRFRSEPAPNCGVTSYRLDDAAGRLVLDQLNTVYY